MSTSSSNTAPHSLLSEDIARLSLSPRLQKPLDLSTSAQSDDEDIGSDTELAYPEPEYNWVPGRKPAHSLLSSFPFYLLIFRLLMLP